MTDRPDGGNGAERRARRILERLSGSSRSLDESAGALDASRVADRLEEIEQLFLLHGGERDVTFGPSKDEVLFEWGPLQVLEPLGAGTFGEVFRAYDRTLDRDIALKLLKGDQGRPFQSQLFLHEARQLARVRHRHVLAVHGAAVHDGRPGLWTDLIDGVTAHDDSLQGSFRDLDAALALVESLAQALQAVHAAGLVHGDVKPSNLMRDEHGEWVLMDFGASRAAQRGDAGPSLTSGTPLYMAPEVVLGDAPDVRADRYSMGATLYRVLSGSPPFEVNQWEELRALHRGGACPEPVRLPADAGGRVARLIERLMNPDADARPGMGAVLAEVRAIREAPHKRFRRIALGSIAGVLVVGLALTSVGFYRANEALLLAEQEQRNTYAVNEFLQRVLHAPSSSGRGRDLTVEEMLREAATNVERALADQPAARIIVRRVLAASYNAMHLTEQAEAQVRIGRAELEAEGLSMPAIERKLALEEIIAAANLPDREAAIARAQRFVETWGDALGSEHVDLRYAYTYMAENLLASGRLDEAEAILDAQFGEVPEPETAPDHFGFVILRNRTNLHREQGRFEQALEAAEQAVDWLDRFPRAATNDRNDALTNLAISLVRVNEMPRAVDVFAELVPLQERIYGPGTNEHVAALSNLTAGYNEVGRFDDALATVAAALEAIEANPGSLHGGYRLMLMANRAVALNATGQQVEGETLIRRTREQALELLGPQHQLTVELDFNLAELLSEQGRFEEARAVAEPALERNVGAFGETHYLTLLAQDNLAVALAGLGRHEEALALHDGSREALQAQMGADHPFTLQVERHRLATLQDFAPARIEAGAAEDLVRRHEAAFGAEHPTTDKARALLNR